MTKALMFQGTGSDVGKTVLVAGLCRALKRRGLSVVPFKPQNMSNNAAVAEPEADGSGGGELGRAQWLQALACGVPASVHMNPVLLKPQSETGSQIVVQGRVTGSARARDYAAMKPKLLEAVMDSFSRCSARADFVLVEGAGSPAEINLRAGDIANMGFAERADVPVMLVGDIDRGGVIASIVGTHTILPESDRERIAGYLINKFRGDVSLFDAGLEAITRFTGWPSFGVLPHLDCVRRLPAEDSVVLERLAASNSGGLKIVVPVLGKIANFDDLDPLGAEPGVELVYLKRGETFPDDAALVILPGSKSTIADRIEFGRNGWDEGLRNHVARGGQVIGICGGYQMLGRRIADPGGIEGDVREVEGLGLLDIETVLAGEKTVRNSEPRLAANGLPLSGYEIHMGQTKGADCLRSMIETVHGPDGAISPDGRVMGCYLHGLFSSDAYRNHLLGGFGVEGGGNYRQIVEDSLDELAEAMETHLDVEGLLATARTVRI
ncbi:MAG: cobyric acid synthase [Nitratireductor sp.]|nr:cobyric acid synthase [Nitratireductor sp.]